MNNQHHHINTEFILVNQATHYTYAQIVNLFSFFILHLYKEFQDFPGHVGTLSLRKQSPFQRYLAVDLENVGYFLDLDCGLVVNFTRVLVVALDTVGG